MINSRAEAVHQRQRYERTNRSMSALSSIVLTFSHILLLTNPQNALFVSAEERIRPLTEILPEPVELAVFPATVLGALRKLGSTPNAVIHIVGASDVEGEPPGRGL
jgi:hypothetical protein